MSLFMMRSISVATSLMDNLPSWFILVSKVKIADSLILLRFFPSVFSI